MYEKFVLFDWDRPLDLTVSLQLLADKEGCYDL